MSKLEESIGFYRKMSDLQEKLRRSEEERLQLEDRFALLMRACRDEEEARLNNLRERYESFLEEEKHRKERNDKILQTLDRIESRAAILTAKSERLKLLRKNYEVYLVRMYPGWKYDNNRLVETPLPIHSKLNSEAERNLPYTSIMTGAANYPLTHTVNQANPTQTHPVVNQTLSSTSHPYPVSYPTQPYQTLPSASHPYSTTQSQSVVNQPLSSASHPYPSVSHPILSTQPHQPIASVGHPYPSVSHPVPSTQPHQPIPSASHPYLSVSHPIPSSTQPHQPIPSVGHPYPSVSHPIPSSTQPHQPIPSVGHPYPSVSHPIPSSTQPHQPIPSVGHPYPSVSHPILSSTQPHQLLPSASHPYSTVPSTEPQPSASHPYLTVNYPPSQPYVVPGTTPTVKQTFPPVHTTTPSSVASTAQKPTLVSVVDQSYLIPGVSPEFAISTALPLLGVEPTPTIDVTSPLNTQVHTDHSVQRKQEEEELFSNLDEASPEVKKMDQIDGYLGRAAEMLKMSGINGNDDKNLFQNLNRIMLKDDKHLGNSIDIELEQNTSGDILNVTLSDDGILQDEPTKTLVSPTPQTTSQNKHIKFTDDVQFEIQEEADPQQRGSVVSDVILPKAGSTCTPGTDIPESEEQKKLTDVPVIEESDVNETTEVGETQDEASVDVTKTEGQYVEGEQQLWDENAAQYYQHDGQYYQYGDEMYQQEYAQGDYDQQEYAEGEYDQQYTEDQYNQQYAEYSEEEYQQQYAYYQNYEAEHQKEAEQRDGEAIVKPQGAADGHEAVHQANGGEAMVKVQQADNSGEEIVKVQQADDGEGMVKVRQVDKDDEAMVKVLQADNDAAVDGEALMKVQQADNSGDAMVKVQQANDIVRVNGEAMVKVQQTDNGGEAMVKVQQADNGGEAMVEVQQADDHAAVDGKAMVKVLQADDGAGVDSVSSREVVKPGGALPDISSDVTDPSLGSEKVEQYRQLLGVPAVGELETSDTDELEVQLAALVDAKHDDGEQPAHPVPSDRKTSEPAVKPVVEDTATSLQNKLGPHVDVKPVVAHRPISKKLPDLHKVLESDSESLQLDATVSNAESDDFDFSSDK